MTELQNQVVIENEVEITKQQMFDLFRGVKRNQIIYLETLTKVQMNKTGNPYFDQVVKHNRCTYMVVVNYKKRVNGNREKEGTETNFVPQVPKGFVRITECLDTDEKTGTKTYLKVERFMEIKPKTTYYFNGNEIEKSEFEPFLISYSKPKSQGVDRIVYFQRFDFNSIMRFTFNKVKYKVLHE
jgi:hypothetical protein